MLKFTVSETAARALIYTAEPRAVPRWAWLTTPFERVAFAGLTVLMVGIILGSEFIDFCRGKQTRALGEMDDEGEA